MSSTATSVYTFPTTITSTASPALFNRVTYQYSSSLTTSQEAGRYQVMDMQSTDGSMVPQLHAANPNLKLLTYAESIYSSPSDPTGLTTCTDYNTDNTNANAHPGDPQYDWFLKDQNGNRVDDLMDVGNPYYQAACAAHATALAKQSGFDGVFFDDVGAVLAFYLPSGVTIPEYPTQSSWDNAEVSLTSYLGPHLHSNGLLAFANVGASTASSTFWQDATTPLDGSMEESFTDGGLGLAQQISDWSAKLSHIAWSEANGKYAVLHSWSTTETGNAYGLASMLLVADGKSSYSTSNANYTSYETWYPEYNTAQQLGVPAGPYTQLLNGVYERDFANGIVLVNPTSSSIPAFPLGGGTYSGSGLANVTTASLSPTSGLILLRVG